PGITGVSIEDDPARSERRLVFSSRGLSDVSAQAASDGTLRLLVLLAALHDRQAGSLVCIEEPENGLFPAHVPDLLEHIGEVVVHHLDQHPRDPRVHLLQVIVVTHSPAAVRGVLDKNGKMTMGSVVFVDTVSRHAVDQPSSTVTRVRLVAPGGAPSAKDAGGLVSPAELSAFALGRGAR
ncbi:MAG: hypothetical protein QOE61_5476, partial [Micromonosporaceae bacterium]|nr:hypothetical protein [Micromonosporaceae bacterium]